MPPSHLKRILVNVKAIQMGVRVTDRDWWNWRVYIRTWRMIDKKPNTPLEKLPLWPVMARHFKRRGRKPSGLKWQVGHVVELYKEIKKNGYDQDKEKRIRVKIRNDGMIECTDGHHRISMLRHMGHPKQILVDVRMGLDTQKSNPRARKWRDIKQKSFDLYNKKFLYQPIDHPDFADWEVNRSCADRFEQILSFVGSVDGKRILDIGSCTGWFCHRLVERGARAVGVEKHRGRVDIARMISKYHKLPKGNPRFVIGTFEKLLETNKKKYDVILFLSVFHHYLRTYKHEAFKYTKLLSEHTNILFIDLSERNLPFKWEPEAVLKDSEFTKLKILPGDNRRLFVYSR